MTAETTCRSHDPDRLYRMRMSRGLSMRGLAERAGVALGTVWHAEAGHEIRADTLRRFATGLGCEITDLMAPEGRAAE